MPLQLRMLEPIGPAFKAFALAERDAGRMRGLVTCWLDGDKITPTQTPAQLELEEGVVLDVRWPAT